MNQKERNDLGRHKAVITRMCLRINHLIEALEIADATIDRLANTPAKVGSVQGTKSIIRDAIDHARKQVN